MLQIDENEAKSIMLVLNMTGLRFILQTFIQCLLCINSDPDPERSARYIPERKGVNCRVIKILVLFIF